MKFNNTNLTKVVEKTIKFTKLKLMPVEFQRKVFLERLNFTVDQTLEYSDKVNNKGVVLFRKTIFSTYLDCVRLGLKEQADTILSRLQKE